MSQYDVVLNQNKYMALATICEDGSPWNVPVKFGVLDDVIYWRSSETTVHSQNIARDGRVSLSICDAEVRPAAGERQAVYVQSVASKVEDADEARVLQEIGERFSHLDDTMPIYCAPIGEPDEARSTSSRFYRTHKEEVRV